jgi:hypothetical protein
MIHKNDRQRLCRQRSNAGPAAALILGGALITMLSNCRVAAGDGLAGSTAQIRNHTSGASRIKPTAVRIVVAWFYQEKRAGTQPRLRKRARDAAASADVKLIEWDLSDSSDRHDRSADPFAAHFQERSAGYALDAKKGYEHHKLPRETIVLQVFEADFVGVEVKSLRPLVPPARFAEDSHVDVFFNAVAHGNVVEGKLTVPASPESPVLAKVGWWLGASTTLFLIFALFSGRRQLIVPALVIFVPLVLYAGYNNPRAAAEAFTAIVVFPLIMFAFIMLGTHGRR